MMPRDIWEESTLKSKSPERYFSNGFLIMAVVTGMLLASCVALVSAYVSRRNSDARLATEIEYIKRQYSYYIEYNNTEAARSLIRKAESAKLIRDCDENVTQEELRQYAEEIAATGITILDQNISVMEEYTKDSVGFEEFGNMLNTDTIAKVMHYDNDIYMKRIEMEDSSYVDVAVLECPAGALIVYRHSAREFAVKSMLSIQNLLDGYEKEQNGTFVIMDGADIVASNDSAFLPDAISSEDYDLVYSIRHSGQADTMVRVKKKGESGYYYGRFTHGRTFYICAFLSGRQIYENTLPVVISTIVLYIFFLAVIQAIRMRASKKREYSHKLELEKKNEDLTKAVAAAENANRSKQAFLFNMSHDIRTPMNAIIGFTELAGQNIEDRTKVSDYLQKIMVSSRHLLNLINDILDMSRIENGKVTIETVPVCVKDQMDIVKNVVHSDIIEKGLTYVEKTVDLDDVYVFADSLHVNRVLINIISNAVKFTPDGGTITFTLRERKSGREGYAYYDFIIEDTGIGMSREFLGHIFEQFAREKTSTVSHTQGTGLGMSITKSLVDLMGGEITVDSELGKGSVFTVTLEFRLTTGDMVNGNAGEAESSPLCNLSGRRVLLVEDNELNMEIAVAMLQTTHIEIDTARDGSEALEKVKNSSPERYDLILMDIQMPMMNGYEATRAIRALEDRRKAEIPIIAMTANAFEEDRTNAFAAGMNAHIAKPLDITVLTETIVRELPEKRN